MGNLLPATLALALAASDGPVVVEVPPSGVPQATPQRSSLFVAAPFTVRGGRVRRGSWTSSDEILGDGWTNVVVVASWCPSCRTLLERLAAQGPRDTVILFLEQERDHYVARRGGGGVAAMEEPLAYPEVLESYPLPLYLLRSGSALGRKVTHYPFYFTCSRARCVSERVRR